ncbi:MAG: hypothetical protein JWL62_1523, partial [Hyphomicrobiales bacterium]|nr:hypothetical protein [Hyphomicrobiales bacterium]
MQGVATAGLIRTIKSVSLAAIVTAGLAWPAAAQSVADLAKLPGPDRMQKL